MTKHKPGTLLLIGGVCMIWFWVGYTFLSRQTKPLITPLSTTTSRGGWATLKKAPPYVLSPYEVDPFLGLLKSPSIKRSQPKQVQKQSPWPELEYLGYVASSDGDRYLFQVNQQTFLFRHGKRKEGLLLLRKGHQLELQYQGEKRLFPRELKK